MLAEEQVKTTADEPILDATDRCDRCGSQAYIWVNAEVGDLLFCAHHFQKWEDSIRSWAIDVLDERRFIK